MAKKKYNPGTYSAEAKGIGKVKVNLTVDQDKITDVKLDLANESKNIGQAAQNTIKNQILDAQSSDIDGVSGASLTTRAVKTAVNDALAKAQGGKIILSTTVKKLLLDNGKATGVVADNNGQQFTVTAKNIVFASGGTSHGKEKLMAKAMPSVAKVDLYNEANVGNTGDAYDMLSKIGAVKDGEDVYKNGFPDFGQPLFITWMNQPNFGNGIIINEEGKRFTNETPLEPSNLSTALFEEGSSRYYVILDGKIIDPDFKKKLDQVEQAPKVVEKADKLAALAKKINIDSSQLQKTVAAYNRITKTKRDPFGKQAQNLQKFTGENGYYAVYIMPGSWGTMGGVKINRQMQVLKNDGGHFANIFAAGEVATGDLFSEYYMGGFSLAYYSTEGRLIAEELSKK